MTKTELGVLTKEQAKAVLTKLGDSLDGSSDGAFHVEDLVGRVTAEARRVATLPERVAAHPVEYFWKGIAAGVVVGIIVSPIAQGVAKMVGRFVGIGS